MNKEELNTATAKGLGVKVVPYVPTAQATIEGGLGGGPFTVVGEKFGDQKGVLMIGTTLVKTTSWSDRRIKGQMPAGLSGPVTVIVDGETRIVERKA